MRMRQDQENRAEYLDRWELDARRTDIIAIGSQVVYGTVGLSASVPVLTSHGLKVAALPTAMLTNLPNYPSVHALDFSPFWVPDALNDLDALGISAEVETVYTGYFSSPQQVKAVASWLAPLAAQRPELRVVVDPTLGDYDVGLYTDPAVAGALRDELIPLATGLVPNHFELQHLTGSPIDAKRGVDALIADARSLLGPRGKGVVATGLSSHSGADVLMGDDLVITPDHVAVVDYERLEVSVKGTGDVMAASIVAQLHLGQDITQAVEAAGSAVRQRMLSRSISTSN